MPKSNPPKNENTNKGACPTCKGNGRCPVCDGVGCMSCNYTGTCRACGGSGLKASRRRGFWFFRA